MSNILPFQPRRPTLVDRLAPTQQIDIRAEIEEAAHSAIDAADRLLALLDGMGGDPDREPCLGTPEIAAQPVDASA